MTPVHLSDNRTLWRCPLNQSDPDSMELYLVKDGMPLSRELVLQMVELVRLASSLWSSQHAEVQISELIRAIMRDEPLKMRRLAKLFHIDVASIRSMWVLRIDNAEETQRQKFAKEVLAHLREILTHRSNIMLADAYEGYIVGFTAWQDKGENLVNLSNELVEQLANMGIQVTLTRCHNLEDTADVRQAFLLIKDQIDNAKCIWPTRQNYSLEELEFANQCHKTVDEGEKALAKALKPLGQLEGFSEGAELLNTLCVYLLDAESSVIRCAELLFLHKNTIKYRLSRIGICLGHHIDKEPEKYYLYRAAVIHRLLEKQNT